MYDQDKKGLSGMTSQCIWRR